MRSVLLATMAALGAGVLLPAAAASAQTNWDRISVAPMKTSIYFGSVTLTTGAFVRQGSTLTTAYTARVFPWFFWDESGRIVIRFTDTDLAKLARGETAQFTGAGVNKQNKPRQVTGRAQPADATTGNFKIHIMADGDELIFNGTYRFGGN